MKYRIEEFSGHHCSVFKGENQQPHFPGLTRGLVTVLLYWDGKRCLANSLRSLIQSRHGKSFTLDLRYGVFLVFFVFGLDVCVAPCFVSDF